MNIRLFTCEEISEAIDGKIILWNSNRLVSTFTSRLKSTAKNSIYFLYDNTISEATLIANLVQANSSGIVFEEGSYSFNLKNWYSAGLGLIEVSSLDRAFMRMAGLYTSNANIPIVQVIGSSGKTTTKEMVGAILQYNMPTVIGAENFNTSIGIARHVSSLRDFHGAAVFEAGINGRGVMRLSTSIIRPTIGIVTSIHRAHLSKIGSMEEIIAAKSEILEYLKEDGYLIINGEDEYCRKFPIQNFKGHIRTFGFSDKCDIWASNIETKDFKTCFTAQTKNIQINCTINTVGKYNVANALAAIQAGLIIGIEPENIVKGLSTFNPYPDRLQILKGTNNTTIIDDNFNANPDSTRLLLENIQSFRENRPVILVIGDMENPKDKIAEYASKVHFEIGQLIAGLKLDYLFAIGKWAKEYVNGAASSGMEAEKIFYFRTPEEAKDNLLKSLISNAIVLFKSSATYVDLSPLIDELSNLKDSELAISNSSETIDLKNVNNRILLVDIDGVLAVEDHNIPLSKRSVISDSQKSLKYLKQKGFRIVLHTSRFESQREETIEWLEKNNIPFDSIVFEKPRGILYIDERGYRFNSWKQFFDEVDV